MNYWSMMLHFYQPPTQTLRITQDVLTSCYLPLLHTLLEHPHARVTCNISGSLIEQLKTMGATEFFESVTTLISRGQIELVTSTKYHALIPLISPVMRARQIQKNTEAIAFFWPEASIKGFFPPELAITPRELSTLNFSYVYVDETALAGKKTQHYEPIALINGQRVLVNNHSMCHLLRAYPGILSDSHVIAEFTNQLPSRNLLVTANDAELFGHHYENRRLLLAQLFSNSQFSFITASEAISQFGAQPFILSQEMRPSTWDECLRFDLWDKNRLQRNYLHMISRVDTAFQTIVDPEAIDLFDQANSSCYLYWLSNWPWWHPDLVESGARLLIAAVRRSAIPTKSKSHIESRYYSFLSAVWKYHWSGEVEKQYQRFDAQKQNAMEFHQ